MSVPTSFIERGIAIDPGPTSGVLYNALYARLHKHLDQIFDVLGVVRARDWGSIRGVVLPLRHLLDAFVTYRAVLTIILVLVRCICVVAPVWLGVQRGRRVSRTIG